MEKPSGKNLQVGDVVLVLKRKLLDDGWEVGVVEETACGPDGQVRTPVLMQATFLSFFIVLFFILYLFIGFSMLTRPRILGWLFYNY